MSFCNRLAAAGRAPFGIRFSRPICLQRAGWWMTSEASVGDEPVVVGSAGSTVGAAASAAGGRLLDGADWIVCLVAHVIRDGASCWDPGNGRERLPLHSLPRGPWLRSSPVVLTICTCRLQTVHAPVWLAPLSTLLSGALAVRFGDGIRQTSGFVLFEELAE